MPVARGTEIRLTRSLVFAVVSLALGVGLVVLVVQLAGSGGLEVSLGDEVFDAGAAADRAEQVADDGPILFASLSRGRPVFLQHLGDDPTTGWFAIDARSPSDPDTCALRWVEDERHFVDDCAPGSTFPADGTGLIHYDVSVDEAGDLFLDLREPELP